MWSWIPIKSYESKSSKRNFQPKSEFRANNHVWRCVVYGNHQGVEELHCIHCRRTTVYGSLCLTRGWGGGGYCILYITTVFDEKWHNQAYFDENIWKCHFLCCYWCYMRLLSRFMRLLTLYEVIVTFYAVIEVIWGYYHVLCGYWRYMRLLSRFMRLLTLYEVIITFYAAIDVI